MNSQINHWISRIGVLEEEYKNYTDVMRKTENEIKNSQVKLNKIMDFRYLLVPSSKTESLFDKNKRTQEYKESIMAAEKKRKELEATYAHKLEFYEAVSKCSVDGLNQLFSKNYFTDITIEKEARIFIIVFRLYNIHLADKQLFIGSYFDDDMKLYLNSFIDADDEIAWSLAVEYLIRSVSIVDDDELFVDKLDMLEKFSASKQASLTGMKEEINHLVKDKRSKREELLKKIEEEKRQKEEEVILREQKRLEREREIQRENERNNAKIREQAAMEKQKEEDYKKQEAAIAEKVKHQKSKDNMKLLTAVIAILAGVYLFKNPHRINVIGVWTGLSLITVYMIIYTSREVFKLLIFKVSKGELSEYKLRGKKIRIPNHIFNYRVTGVCYLYFKKDDIFHKLKKELPCYSLLKSKNKIEKAFVEDGIKSIGSCAFSFFPQLTEIRLPDTLTSIEGRAFEYCESLKEITIPEGVKYIGSFAFKGCESLTEIKIPYGVEKIDFGAFYGCKNLKKLDIHYKTNYDKIVEDSDNKRNPIVRRKVR